eukprot:9465963-Pyramimonas_sp.AAC.2
MVHVSSSILPFLHGVQENVAVVFFVRTAAVEKTDGEGNIKCQYVRRSLSQTTPSTPSDEADRIDFCSLESSIAVEWDRRQPEEGPQACETVGEGA